MMLGVSSSILVQMIEIGFIGQLGTDYIAAITFTFPLVMVLSSISLGISIGTSSVIARQVGLDRNSSAADAISPEVKSLGTHSLVLVTSAMAVLVFICWLSIDPLFLRLGADPALLPKINGYLSIYLPGSILFTTAMICGSIMRANGSASIPGMIMTLGSAINLLLDPFLIFGWWGLPRLELEGAAWAMTASRMITLVITFGYLYRSEMINSLLRLSGFWHSTRRILHVGLPAIATNLIGPITMGIITRLLAAHGETAVAGFGVASRIEAVAVMLLFALSGSIGPFVGQNLGAGEIDRVKQGVRVSHIFSMSWGGCVALLLLGFGAHIVLLVDDNVSVMKTALLYLSIVPWSYGCWGMLMMASASFNAIGKPLPSTIMSFTRMLVFYVPLALLLNDLYGVSGIFTATAISNTLFGIVGLVWFRAHLRSQRDRPLAAQPRALTKGSST
tara:strand:+ start:492 stop:1832 length:1341 start_codon:yes stop_codon:yes gene_type:complete